MNECCWVISKPCYILQPSLTPGRVGEREPRGFPLVSSKAGIAEPSSRSRALHHHHTIHLPPAASNHCSGFEDTPTM